MNEKKQPPFMVIEGFHLTEDGPVWLEIRHGDKIFTFERTGDGVPVREGSRS